MGETRRFDLTVALAALLVLVSLGPLTESIRSSAAVDYYHFWLVGQAVRAGEVHDVYAHEARVDVGERSYQRAMQSGAGAAQRRAATKFRRLETTATPFLYASFFPLVSGSYERDRVAFNAASLVLFAIAVAALAWKLGYGVRGLLLWLAFLLLAFEPVLSDVRVGNVNRLQFACLTLYAFLLGRVDGGGKGEAAVAGLWMGLAVAWKPNLAFPLAAVGYVWWLRDSGPKWRAHLVGLCAGGLAAFVVSSLFFGDPRIWLWWADAAKDLTRDFPVSLADGNFAPVRALRHVSGVDLGVSWTLACLLLGGLGLTRVARAKASGTIGQDAIPLLGFGSAVALLAAPLSWLHYYTSALFVALWILRPREDEQPASPWVYAVGLAALVATSMGPVLQLFLASSPIRWAVAGNAGVLAFVVLITAELTRGPTPVGHAADRPPATPAHHPVS